MDEHNRHDIRHRVVTTGLQLQHRLQILLEPHLAVFQYAEYRGRIRRRHYRCQQETHHDGQRQSDSLNSGKKIDECSREYDRKEDAQGRKHDTRSDYGTDFLEFCFKTAREQDDAQCYYTEELREIIIVEYKSESVASEQHSDQQEYEEGRNPVLVSRFGNDYSCKYQD